MNGTRHFGVALGIVVRAAPWPVAGVVALAVAAAAVPLGVAWLTKLVLDAITTPGTPTATVLWFAAGLAFAGLASAAVPHLTRYLDAEIGRRVGLAAQDRLYAAVNGYRGLARFEDPGLLDRLRLAQQSGDGVPAQLLTTVIAMGRAAVTGAGFLASLLIISPWMAAAVLAGAVPALLGELRLARERAHVARHASPIERREAFYATLLATVAAAKEVRLFGIGDFLRGRMRAERNAVNALHRRVDRRTLAVDGTLAALSAAVAGAGLFWAVRAAASGALTVGDVSMFIAAVAAVQASLAALVGTVAATHQGLLLFAHYQAVVTAPPDLPVASPARTLPPLRHGVELRDVWFRYSPAHPWILRGVNLTIPFGRSVALVGLNGAGKSTLVKLLCRFYDPTRGQLRWDGVDLRDVPVDELRGRISATFQDYMHYDLTAAENIGLGDLDRAADPANIRRAAWHAGIHDRLARLPAGYDTLLSRSFLDPPGPGDRAGGVVLSGGEWQRVSLGRSFLRCGRDLLILDEPTAGLDAAAEHAIHQRLRAHRDGATSLLISHRLGTIRDADVIVVLRDGVIAERGRHDELLARGGDYAELYRLQARGYSDGSMIKASLTSLELPEGRLDHEGGERWSASSR